jgi:hypothetical protein
VSLPDEKASGAAWRTRSPGGGAEYGAAYGRTIDALRVFLDRFAEASPDEQLLAELEAVLNGWSSRLEPLAVRERERVYGRRQELPGLGQVTSPQFFADTEDDHAVTGRVRFGQYFLGGNMAAHGGTIPLFFDEVLGRLAQSGRTPCRTAYLHTDYRSITPIGPELTARAWFVEESGRKRFVRGTLHHGDVLCAEADALFVGLRPGQP